MSKAKTEPEVDPKLVIPNMLECLGLVKDGTVHPATLDIFMRLLDSRVETLALLGTWYSLANRPGSNWKVFLEINEDRWLWVLYHNQCNCNLDRLVCFMSEEARLMHPK